MTSKAFGLAQLGNAYADGALSNRNIIINGAMQVAQRGTSFSGHTDGYTLDRWRLYRAGDAVYTVSQSSNAPSGFSKSLRVECSTADAVVDGGDYSIIQYNIEGQDLQQLNYGSASAQPITMSFWVRSNVTGVVTITNEVNKGPPFLAQDFTISQANTWEYKTLTWVGNTSTSIDDDNTTGIEFQMWLNAGGVFKASTYNSTTWNDVSGSRVNHSNINLSSTVGNYIEITGVQLEAGDTATPFEHRSYGAELALCQRYYFRFNPSAGNSNTLGVGFVDSSTSSSHTHYFPGPMRAAPSALEQSGTAGDYAVRRGGGASTTCSAVPAFSDANITNATFRLAVSSGLTAGQAVAARAVNTNAYLAWSAEL